MEKSKNVNFETLNLYQTEILDLQMYILREKVGLCSECISQIHHFPRESELLYSAII